MLIDPFTIIAQIVNFAILAVALKLVLYDRVIAAMDAREASIAERLEQAAARETEAAGEAQAYQRRREDLQARREELIDQARRAAHEHQQELLEEARSEVDDERRRWQRALRAEQEELHRELQLQATEQIIEIARGVLRDLADTELETHVIDSALARLAADAGSRRALFDPAAGTPLKVRTALALGDDHRRMMVERLHAAGLDERRAVRFEQDPDLLLGVEFHGDGTAVSWCAEDYLSQLSSRVDELIDESVGPGEHR